MTSAYIKTRAIFEFASGLSNSAYTRSNINHNKYCTALTVDIKDRVYCHEMNRF